jgi:hypothetical protein
VTRRRQTRLAKIRLKQIDLSRSRKHECPGIEVGQEQYLCLIGGEFFAGRFSRQWYGLNFGGWYDTGLQFDEPDTNASRWQGVWRILRVRPARKARKP